MAVKLFLVDGTERDYPDATSVAPGGPVFSISRWNPKRRKLEEVTAIQSKYVIRAEVSRDGILKEVIFSEGRRPSN